MSYTIHEGSVFDVLPRLPAQSFHTAITSPPYWKLRKYGGGPDEIGAEPTVEEYVAKLAGVFLGVRRVLRDDGTLWLNLGDTTDGAGGILGVPWRVAFGLMAHGWQLVAEVIWAKLDPMTRRVKAPMPSHEQLFLFRKEGHEHYYDVEATKEPGTCAPTRLLRDVWTIAKQSYKGTHFAAFPEKLVTPCVLAATSEKGCCPECGLPMTRRVKRTRTPTRPGRQNKTDETGKANRDPRRHVTVTETIGWDCECPCRPVGASFTPAPCRVLDPFLGSGTTAAVCERLGRECHGVELNPEYVPLIRERVARAA